MGTKHYKPGQIVTIDCRRYRIKKASENSHYICWACVYEHLNANHEPCYFCIRHLCNYPGLYLEPIESQIQIRKRLCTSQGKQ